MTLAKDKQEAMQEFAKIFARYPRFEAAYRGLAERSALLERSARTALQMQGKRLARPGEEILGFVRQECAGSDFLDLYVERVTGLMRMQERFYQDPGPHTLGDPNARVSREAYNVALLLSIPFANHRFEIVEQLNSFLEFIRTDQGRIAAVGVGTGYELKLMAAALRGWDIEGYDLDPLARETAARLLNHFACAECVRLAADFPLDEPESEYRGRYDALVLCEILEHLPDPARALTVCREYLKGDGQIFATMAVNLAQEDHIFLYPDAAACREQMRSTGYEIIHEWIAPVLVGLLPAGADRESILNSGNYIAVARPA